MRSIRMLAILMLGLSACTTSRKVGPLNNQPLSIAFTQARSLEIEPCGCSFGQAGGVVREMNALTKWKSEPGRQWLQLSGGTTFVPVQGKVNSAFHARKAKALVEAMNILGVSALAPGAKDFGLSLSDLQSWKEQSNFKWISTNVFDKKTGKTAFEPIVWVNWDKQAIAIVSASRGGVPEAFELRAPEQSIRDALKDRKPDMLVVLSELNGLERTRLSKAFAFRMVILGQEGDLSTDSVTQWDAETLFQSPLSRGRTISRLDLNLSGDAHWFSPLAQDEYRAAMKGWIASESNFKAQLKKAPTDTPLHKSLAESWFEVNHSLARANEILSVKSGAAFSGESVLLGDAWIEPANSLSKVVQKFHADTREQALATTH